MSSTLGLVVRPGIEKALTLAKEVVVWAQSHGHKILLEEETASLLGLGGGVSGRDLAVQADPIVVLGGDGTLIGIAHFVEGRIPTLVGVNFGHLGFLTELSPDELMKTLPLVLAGTARVAERSMILATVIRDGREIFATQGVNEAVVLKGADQPLLEIDLSVDNEEVMRLRADGLIIGTSTGSTAYSLAAGGSIVYPTLPVVLVTPLCPHSLTVRPLILKLDSELTLSIPEYPGVVFLSVDGQLSTRLSSGDIIKIQRAQNSVRFVRSPSRSYFEILRTKLNWGIANKPD